MIFHKHVNTMVLQGTGNVKCFRRRDRLHHDGMSYEWIADFKFDTKDDIPSMPLLDGPYDHRGFKSGGNNAEESLHRTMYRP